MSKKLLLHLSLCLYAILCILYICHAAPAFAEESRGALLPKKGSTTRLEIESEDIHPDSNEVIVSHIGLSRTIGSCRTGIEVSHPGYYQYHGQDKPEVWSGKDGFVNILSFDTGAHMWSTVLILCKNNSTEVVTYFDAMVYKLCKAHKKAMVPGYVSVCDIDHHTLSLWVHQRKMVEAYAKVRVEADGSLTLLSYTVRH